LFFTLAAKREQNVRPGGRKEKRSRAEGGRGAKCWRGSCQTGLVLVWREPCLDRAPARAAQSSGVHPQRSEVEQRGGANRIESQSGFLLAGWRMRFSQRGWGIMGNERVN